MSSISLYRKYRPDNFQNLVGQEHVKKTLINALKSDRVAHAYIFAGPRGTGKTSSARLLAKALCCENLQDGFEPCGNCDLCNDIASGRLIDLVEIDAASNRGIDEVRDLKEKIGFAPTRAKYKIYIIDEVHMMTKEAFNALLKTLEEPPEHAYFILATTEIHKIPETIISRCQRFDFRRISKQEMVKRLGEIAEMEGIDVELSALEMMARYADGGLRDAIGLLEQFNAAGKVSSEEVQNALGISQAHLLDDLFKHLLAKEAGKAVAVIDTLHNQGSDMEQFAREFIFFLRERMLEMAMRQDFGKARKLIGLIEVFQDAKSRIESDIPQLPLEMAIIKITGAEKLPKEEVAAEVVLPTEASSNASKAPSESEFSLEALSEKWPRITERVAMPSLKMSLRNGKPVALNGNVVTLEFGTNFHMEKVMDHDSRVELEGLIKNVFSHEIKLKAQVKEVELQPVIEQKPTENRSTVTDEAMKIFGGEIIED